MAAAFSQSNRVGKLFTALGRDALVLQRFSGTDRVNGLFTYHVDALSTDRDIDFDLLSGTHATIELFAQTGSTLFDGVVTESEWAGAGENGHRYRLTLRPWFWLSDLRRNQRIFHEMTVVEILEELWQPYAEHGDPAWEMRLTGDYPALEYTVQYRESDMSFAARMMERFGISYHFKPGPGGHTMVLTDQIDSHEAVPDGVRPYRGYDGHHLADEEHFWEWRQARNVTTGAMRLIDFNFKYPTAAMEVDQTGDATHHSGQIESFDYPGDFLEQGQGKDVAALRMAQERGQDHRIRAEGDCTSLCAGLTFELTGDEIPGATGKSFLCLAATHSFDSESYGTGTTSDGFSYSGQYVLMPDSAPLAPRRKTSRPDLRGPQTAMVVGDGEIDCDEYGRILVRFHWDLAGAHSMRCRVVHSWAGQGWGSIAIPRIGMEVVVDFLEGDPDQPVVTGCVYNGRTGMPYDLPANKTRMTIKSKSHMQAGSNELRFEDAGGAEEIYMHAQKDHNTVVENNESHQILNDRSKSVTNNQTETIGANKTITVGGNHTESVDGTTTITLKKDFSTTVTEGNQTVTVAQGTQTTRVEGDQATIVQSGSRTVSVESGGQATTVSGDILTTSENGSVKIQAPGAIILEAPNIILKANGGNFISISDGLVVVEGGQTLINPRETAPDT